MTPCFKFAFAAVVFAWVVLFGNAFAQTTHGTFVDSRDGQVYRYVVMPDGKSWMAQNLNFATDEGSWCYDNDVDNCEIYGRLYNWNTAMTACPQGWRLPSDDDWTTLENAVGDSSTVGTKLKYETGWNTADTGMIWVRGRRDMRIINNTPSTNDFGFSALPGGSRSTASFSDIGNVGEWWTATEDAPFARYRRIKNDHVGSHSFNKAFALSVRCVRAD